MLFFVLQLYNDPVFESKPYYINVDQCWFTAYAYEYSHRYASSLLYYTRPS